MNSEVFLSLLGATDIYLLDQVMKQRYRQHDVILDAGCGTGRNLHCLLGLGYQVYGVDAELSVIEALRDQYPSLPRERFQHSRVEQTSFPDAFFDAIICSAVLHFASDTGHFFRMMNELHRVLKPGGHLLIRMASDIGIENKVQSVGDGVYLIPDGSIRFLLTRELLGAVMDRYSFSFLEEFKTTNVADIRCMSTVVVQKSH